MRELQSAIWNFAATARVSTLSKDGAVEGDLVVADVTVLEPGAAKKDGAAAGGAGEYRGLPEVHVVTAEEAAASKYGLEQVVLPLPGYAVTYPTNGVGAEYVKLLKADGVQLDDRKKQKIADLPGAYRPLVQRCADLTWRVMYYGAGQPRHSCPFRQGTAFPHRRSCLALLVPQCALRWLRLCTAAGDDYQLGYSDFDRHIGNSPPPGSIADEPSATYTQAAVQLSFTLPRSTYATMLLRELNKQDSSVNAQKAKTEAMRNRSR